MNFNICNNPTERKFIYELLCEKDYVTTVYGKNGKDFDGYLSDLYNHCFTICPQGNGIGVHHPWEALYIGTIPIQIKTINNQEWRDLPFCWVDNWEQLLDSDFLASEYARISKSKWDMSKAKFSYWDSRIKADALSLI